MTCREVIEFLMNYLEGDLPEDVRAHFQEHLDLCPPCLVYLKTYQETVQVGKKCLCADDSPLTPVPEELVQAILAARGKNKA